MAISFRLLPNLCFRPLFAPPHLISFQLSVSNPGASDAVQDFIEARHWLADKDPLRHVNTVVVASCYRLTPPNWATPAMTLSSAISAAVKGGKIPITALSPNFWTSYRGLLVRIALNGLEKRQRRYLHSALIFS